jgi:hypothetical protein
VTNARVTRGRADGAPLDWVLLLRAFRDACEWVLDVAAHIARRYPEEVAAVERVRAYVRARIAGRPAQLRGDDLLFTFALVLAAIERDLRPTQYTVPWFVPLPDVRTIVVRSMSAAA